MNLQNDHPWQSGAQQFPAVPPPFIAHPAALQPAAARAEAAQPVQPPAPLAYTVEEAAAALNVSTKTIRRLLARGILTASKALRKKLIPRAQIEGFLKATCDQPKRLL